MNVTPEDRRQLEAIAGDRNAPQKHVWRAKIILATADGCGTAEIMRRSGKAKPVVWRWQERFMQEGVAGLTRDKTRKPGKPPLPPATVQRDAVQLCSRSAEMLPEPIGKLLVSHGETQHEKCPETDGCNWRGPEADRTAFHCPLEPVPARACLRGAAEDIRRLRGSNRVRSGSAS